MANTYFDDEAFQASLVSLLIKDKATLKLCQSLVTAKDFKPKGKSGENAHNRWIVADVALAHFEKYREPLGRLITAELKAHCATLRLQGDKADTLVAYGRRLYKKKILAPTAITDKVVQFKREKIKASAVEELIELQATGELTDAKWMEVSRRAIEVISGEKYSSVDYFKTAADRIQRRKVYREDRFPFLLIPEFDEQVRAIARGHLGLILAPYKRGKSLMLIHIARAYVLQRLNVLYITLEDPVQDVEDRFDASITHLPIKRLGRMPKRFRERFKQFTRLLRAKLRIVDGTEKDVTAATIDQMIEEERAAGFNVDAVIVDYDDEIKALKKSPERRMEFAEIYRDLRKLASTRNIILWTAAQTQRGTGQMKILSGDRLAEDVSKVRKVACALALGQGDWGEESIYIHVAAHKFDRQHWGCNIMSDKDRMLIYSQSKTAAAKKNPPRPKEDDLDD